MKDFPLNMKKMEVHSDISHPGEAQEAEYMMWLLEEGVKWHLCPCEGSLVGSDIVRFACC